MSFSFSKPAQSTAFDGFGLYRFGLPDLASPVIYGALCVEPSFGAGTATGALVRTADSTPFTLSPGEISFYVIAHRSSGPAMTAPAGFARLPDNGTLAGRFVERDSSSVDRE